jgi:hypothetical protein
MKRLVTTRACVEFVESYDYCQFTLNCRTQNRKSFETSVSFDPDAPRHAAAFQRYRLFQHLCACQGIDEPDAFDTQFRCFSLRYFTFRLLEFKAGVWVIDAAGASEPFPINVDWSEADRVIEEMFGVR